ncbi:hypothetical protein Bca4012_028486 [Brassica carinata]
MELYKPPPPGTKPKLNTDFTTPKLPTIASREEEAKENQDGYLSRKNKGFRRRHARSRAGRTPDPKQIYFLLL